MHRAMNNSTTPRLITIVVCAVVALFVHNARAQRLLEKDEIRQLNGVDLLERQGSKLPMDAVFTTADGDEVALAQYFLDDKPTILALVYYECPIVCPTVLRSLAGSLDELDYTAGEDFRVLVISFDHTETTTQALAKRENFFEMYGRATGADSAQVRDGIQFFTGDQASIARIAESVGFEFNQIAGGEYAHPISLMAITPKGVLSRYFYGYNYPAKDMKLTLLDASNGTIAKSLGDRVLHFCYRYDPMSGSYSMVAFRVMQVGAAVSAVVLAGFIGLLFLGERVRRRARDAKAGDEHSSELSSSKGAAVGAAPGPMS